MKELHARYETRAASNAGVWDPTFEQSTAWNAVLDHDAHLQMEEEVPENVKFLRDDLTRSGCWDATHGATGVCRAAAIHFPMSVCNGMRRVAANNREVLSLSKKWLEAVRLVMRFVGPPSPGPTNDYAGVKARIVFLQSELMLRSDPRPPCTMGAGSPVEVSYRWSLPKGTGGRSSAPILHAAASENNCLVMSFEKKKRDKKKGVVKLLLSTSAVHHPRAKSDLPPSLNGALKCDKRVGRTLKRPRKGTNITNTKRKAKSTGPPHKKARRGKQKAATAAKAEDGSELIGTTFRDEDGRVCTVTSTGNDESDDEGHAGWGPTLSFEFTNEDGNVEEQTGTLTEVRDWCDLGHTPED